MRWWRQVFIALVLLLDLLSGLAFVRRAPPLLGFDEGWHWLRAIEISHGRLLPRRLGPNDWGDKLDADAATLASNAAVQAASGAPLRMEPLRRIAAGDQAHGARKQLISFPSTASFPPLAYAPYALGIAMSRGLGADLLRQEYAGRVAGVLAYIALLAGTIGLLPTGRLPALMLMSGPTILYLAASYSSDPLNVALPALLVAWCVRLRLQSQSPLAGWQQAVFACLVMSMGLLKIPTILLAATALLVPRDKFLSLPAYLLVIVGSVLGAIVAALLWNAHYPFLPGEYYHQPIDPAGTLRQILHHPMDFPSIVLHTVGIQGWGLWLRGYARFGGAPPPFNFIVGGIWFACAMLGVLGLMFDAAGAKPDRKMALWLTLIAGANLLAVLLAFRVAYTSRGASMIAGLQGRYFILAQIVLVMAGALAVPNRPRPRDIFIAACASLSLVSQCAIVAVALNRLTTLSAP